MLSQPCGLTELVFELHLYVVALGLFLAVDTTIYGFGLNARKT
jgi:hypothetical protein